MSTDLENQRQLALSRGVALLPDLEPGVADQVMEDLAGLALSNPPHIPMLIKSFGGLTDDGFALAHFIENDLGVPIHADVAYSHSASTYAMLCCAKRVGRHDSHFVLHHQTVGVEGLQYHPDTYDEIWDALRAEQHGVYRRQVQFYMRKLQKPEKDAVKILNAGSAAANNQIDATKALELGILTEIAKKNEEEPP